MNGATLTVQLQEGTDSGRITQLIGLIPGIQSVNCSDLVLTDDPSPKRKRERQRNPVFDALAVLDCPNLNELTQSAGSRVAKALSQIGSVCPGVTAKDIQTRAANYRLHLPNASLTSTALAAHWGRCAGPPIVVERRAVTPHWKLIKDIEERLATHPANPRWVGYVRGAASPGEVSDYQVLTDKLRALKEDVL